MTPADEDALIDKIFIGCQPDMIEAARLAIRVAVAHERERCAAICDSVNNYDNPMTANDCAAAIRRGE